MIYFFSALVISVVLTTIVRYSAKRLNIVDSPDGALKRHVGAVPLLGGVGIWLTFWGVMIYLWYRPILGIEILTPQLPAAFIASFVILLVGVADEIIPYSPKARLALTALAVLVAVVGGVTFGKLTSPIGGLITIGAVLGAVLAFIWLMGMMYTVKILDGLDGLSAGVVAIGVLLIALLTNSAKFYQPNVGLVASVFLGAVLGFLLFNYYPAKIYLGEGGGLFLGFMLGVLAIIGGGKLATAMLVMAVPVLDFARVIYSRFKRGQSIMVGDRKHLHFRLVDAGFKEWQVVLIFYCLAASLGIAALVWQIYLR